MKGVLNMSSNNQRNVEGLTLTVVAQITNVSYHGVNILHKGNGILGQMINPIINEMSNSQSKQIKTTASSLVQMVPMAQLAESQKLTTNIGKVRARLIAENADVNMKVRDFHDRLNQLKEELLAGKDVNYLDSKQLSGLRIAMEPYNVGKVVKVKLQARIFSQTPRPSLRKCATGGYSSVRVLYTFYVEYKEGMDIQVIANAISRRFAQPSASDIADIENQSYKVQIDRDQKTGHINLTPLAPMTVVKTDSSGSSLNIEEVKGSRVRKSAAFNW